MTVRGFMAGLFLWLALGAIAGRGFFEEALQDALDEMEDVNEDPTKVFDNLDDLDVIGGIFGLIVVIVIPCCCCIGACYGIYVCCKKRGSD